MTKEEYEKLYSWGRQIYVFSNVNSLYPIEYDREKKIFRQIVTGKPMIKLCFLKGLEIYGRDQNRVKIYNIEEMDVLLEIFRIVEKDKGFDYINRDHIKEFFE